MQEHIEKLREHIRELDDAGPRRSRFFPLVAESLKATVGEPAPVRRAKAFAHLLDNTPQVVLSHELLAGSHLGNWPLADDLPTYDERRAEAVEALQRYRDGKRTGAHDPQRATTRRWALMARDHYDANLGYDELQTLIADLQEHFAAADDLTDPEIARELEWHFVFDYGEETRELFAELPWIAANHVDLNYQKVVRIGLNGIRRDIAGRLSQAADEEKRIFYESALIAVDAAIRFVERYAETLAAESRQPHVDKGRAAELAEMAGICRKVASQPPETFREALQLLWLVHIIANIGGGSALSFARFDQYMYPFYQRDIEQGVLTRDEARALIGCMWLKVNEPKMRTVQSLCLGGLTPEGEYGATELTRLCLEVCREVTQPYPNLSLRVCRDTPEWVWDEVVETMKAGIGHPMVLNDDTWVPNFERLGYPPEAARDYYNMGCVEMMIQGQTAHWAGCGLVDMPGLLELVFRNGAGNMAGDTGPQTGALDSFRTFDDFLAAYIEQIGHRARLCRTQAERQEQDWFGKLYDPFGSALIDDCVEKGFDMYQGGGRFARIRPVSSWGIGTAADALVAIKRLVFDEQRMTLQELWEILQHNYEAHEELRVELERRMPCFGNDDGEVDEIARRIFAAYTDAVHALNDGTLPGTFVTVMFSYTSHIHGGEVIAATSNGRHRSETISNGIGPTQGKDTNGPTRLINSVTSLDHSRMTGACAFNLKLSPNLVRGETGSAALKALLKTYVEQGGCQVQVNFVDQETLIDAQKHPERHRNLIVRVAGYSEYFNHLDRRLQDEVIRRTAHGV